MMFKEKFAIVDLETTGGSFSYDRVIEVAVIIVENGEVVERFQSLVNPERYVPSAISELTGIKEGDLENAPTFAMLKDQLLELLNGRIFVAHNARFDKGFLKAEFGRQDIRFNPKTLCTVQLSRRIFPHARFHNLDALMGRLRVECRNRHRALDDAEVLYGFFKYIEGNIPEEEIATVLKQLAKETYLPPNLLKEELQQLPEHAGVYVFYDGAAPLYVGKSVNLRDRVLSHFQNSSNSSKELKIFQKVTSVETHFTCGELGALLLESQMIKELQPLHNRRLRKRRLLTAIRRLSVDEGNVDYQKTEIVYLEEISPEKIGEILGVFKSKRQAEKYLEDISKEYSLCQKLLGMEKTKHECFGYQIKRCHGSCVGEENFAEYNQRFEVAFEKTAVRSWPYQGVLAIEEKNMEEGKGEVFFVQDWCLIAKGKYQESGMEIENIGEKVFDFDQYKILNRYISQRSPRGLRKNFKLLGQEDFQKILQEN
jgi:DNA polymerase III subunit epsilon